MQAKLIGWVFGGVGEARQWSFRAVHVELVSGTSVDEPPTQAGFNLGGGGVVVEDECVSSGVSVSA